MTVRELLELISSSTDFVQGSFKLKSYDEYGAVYKYLIQLPNTLAVRKEIFITLDPQESELELGERTVLNWVEVIPAK